MKQISASKSFDGVQYVYSHASEACRCDMTFALYLPPKARNEKVPLLWYLSGLTCTHQNVMDKGKYRRAASELGIAIICPDTSPRGEDVPDERDNWQFGQGAGFYLDATQAPFSHHYNMERYILSELPSMLDNRFPLDPGRQGIFGHSMGGHGAITFALKHPDRFRSVSAFAPIVQPTTADWSRPALEKYLGPDRGKWRTYDATCLIQDGRRIDDLLIDQGTADPFLDTGLRPWLLQDACAKAGIGFTLKMRDGYDHSYTFISTFMSEHIEWHAQRLAAEQDRFA